jgi:hypothetical protein
MDSQLYAVASVASVPLSKLCAHVAAGAAGAASVALASSAFPLAHWLALSSDVSARPTNSEHYSKLAFLFRQDREKEDD